MMGGQEGSLGKRWITINSTTSDLIPSTTEVGGEREERRKSHATIKYIVSDVMRWVSYPYDNKSYVVVPGTNLAQQRSALL